MCDLRQRAAVTTHRGDQDNKILHRPRQNGTDHQPEKTWQKPELRRQHWAEQRTSPSNCREVMAEQDDSIGGMKVYPVVQPHGGRQTRIIQLHHLPSQPPAIKPIGQDVDASRRDDQPEPVHFFGGIDDTDNMGKRHRREHRQQHPEHNQGCFHARDTSTNARRWGDVRPYVPGLEHVGEQEVQHG